MKNREDITNLFNPRSIGCELGVFKGDFSKVLLDCGKFDQLYLVDPFSGSIQSGDKNGNNVEVHDGESLFSSVSKRFEYVNNVFITRQRSHEFLSIFCDNFFDFIYIDTTHQYDQTVLELELSYKKIKNNGIIAGHDYHPQMFGEVVNAVQFFSNKYKLPFTLTTDDVLNTYIFLIQKP
jgi:Methyltransferase domain